jgi:hypothetical protein
MRAGGSSTEYSALRRAEPCSFRAFLAVLLLPPTLSCRQSLAAALPQATGTDCARMFRRSSSAVATSRVGHRSPRASRAVLHGDRAGSGDYALSDKTKLK